jgi:hypothetical protein
MKTECECSTGPGKTTTSRCASPSRSLSVEGAYTCQSSTPGLTHRSGHRSFHRDGHYGLYLDETLYEGSSARCPTFDNDPLCASDPRQGGTATFECVGLEVWGVGPS